MWRVTFELLSYVGFIIVLYLISYLNHQSDEYFQVQHLNRFFLNIARPTHNFSQITSINDYWSWLEESFIENIYPGNWYDGQPVTDLNAFLNDKSTRLIGWATIRQLRVKPNTCRVKQSIQSMIPFCYDEYSFSNEEKRSFYPGWTLNDTYVNYSSAILEAFTYQTSVQLDTYIYLGQHATYGSGGYVYEFRGPLDQVRADMAELHQLGWIDRQSRAVLIQMNFYNPNVPIFTSAMITIELLPSSGAFPNAQFQPLDFNAFQSVFQIFCAIVYLIFIFYFLVLEIRSLIRLKKAYFHQVWSYLEIGITVCSWTCVGVHFWRRHEAERILNLFRQTNGNVYVNFQLMAYINDLFSFLLAFCCFFGTIKLLRLCRYNRRLSLLSDTLRRATRELFSFSCMFAVIFMAFLSLFYLQFVSQIWDCSTLLHTAQMLFEMLLLKFGTSGFLQSQPFLGPLYFTLFILFVVFISINMFVSIINDNFRIVRAEVHKVDDEEQDLFIKMLKKFQRWLGEEETSNRRIQVKFTNQIHVIHVAEAADPIKRLSNKLDQLVTFVNNRYGNE